jgi:hypothetical protein
MRHFLIIFHNLTFVDTFLYPFQECQVSNLSGTLTCSMRTLKIFHLLDLPPLKEGKRGRHLIQDVWN